MAKSERPEVPEAWVLRLDALLSQFPRVVCEPAWVGTRWRVQGATIAHVYGGYDGRIRITFRGESDEVIAFAYVGEPYFKAEWGSNVIGLLITDKTDWIELAELLTDSYCLMAPQRLAAQVTRP
jgi:hypothetical protein